MSRRAVVAGSGALLAAAIAYLLLWPVDLEPVAWRPPEAPRLAGPLAPNRALAGARPLAGGRLDGPEDVAVDASGRIHTGTADGRIVRLAPDGSSPETLAEVEGRPLGMDVGPDGTLWVADAGGGALLAVDPDGAVRRVVGASEGVALGFPNDVAVAPDGRVWFSDASTVSGLAASEKEVIENRGRGRLLVWDPERGRVRTVLTGLHFANGVAVEPSGAFVLVAETSRYRVLRYWLEGERRGVSEFWVENLPGFPDNVSADGDGFWLALFAPRSGALDRLLPHPLLRKALWRLPAFLRPEPESYGLVLELDRDGRVRRGLHGPDGSCAPVTSAERAGDRLLLGSVEGRALCALPLR